MSSGNSYIIKERFVWYDKRHSFINFTENRKRIANGFVVMVELVKLALVIYIRKQQRATGTNRIRDYVACPSPRGKRSGDTNIFLKPWSNNNGNFLGLKTEGEIFLRERLKEFFQEGEKWRGIFCLVTCGILLQKSRNYPERLKQTENKAEQSVYLPLISLNDLFIPSLYYGLSSHYYW